MPPSFDSALPFLSRNQLAFEGSAVFGLSLDVVGHGTDTLQVRGFTKEGAFTFSQVIAAGSAIQTFAFAIPDVPVMVSVALAPSDTTGAVAHCVLYLTANGDRVAVLGQGIINALFAVTWPHQMPNNREQSEGAVVEIPITAPEAGNEMSISVGDNEIWEVFAVTLKLTADANAANRTVILQIQQGTDGEIRRAAGTTQQATEAQQYTFLTGGTSGVTVADQSQEIALPSRIMMFSGRSITTITTSIQAGDAYTDGSVFARRSYKAGPQD